MISSRSPSNSPTQMRRPLSPSINSERPKKKNKLAIKKEDGGNIAKAKIKPPLITFSSAARLYTACYIDMTRASIDLTSEGAAAQETIPLSLIPNANINTMSKLPIVQSPEDPSKIHVNLPQPAAVNRNMPLRHNSDKPIADIAKRARENMDHLLKNPEQRKKHERQSFKIAKIRAKHLASNPGITNRHATINMRGVIASEALKAGTPLQYSGQYLDAHEHAKTTQALSRELQVKIGIAADQADEKAKRLLECYAWEDITYCGKAYTISAFGAGNTAAMINHDDKSPNMGVSYMSTYDASGKPAPQIVVYFALRDIEKDEQLLVNYGECYRFDETSAESHITMETTSPQPVIGGNMLAAMATLGVVKTEASPQTNNPQPATAQNADPQDALAAAILRNLSKDIDNTGISTDSSHLPAATAIEPKRQRALTTFTNKIDKLKLSNKRLDAKENAEFFLFNPEVPLKIKLSSLSDILYRSIENNEAGILHKLRANWGTLSQLHPAVTPTALLDIVNNKGSGRTLDILKDHWHTFSELKPCIPPENLLAIANHDGGSYTLEHLRDHWPVLNQLQPTILPRELLAIADNNGGSGILSYLKDNWTALHQLQPKITSTTLLTIANNDGGSKTLDFLQHHWGSLNQLKPTIAPKDLLSIANNDGGSKTLEYLQKNWEDLNQLTPKINSKTLLEIANHDGGSKVLNTLKVQWHTLNQLEPKVAPARLLKIANNSGGSKALDNIRKNWTALNQLQPPIAAETLLGIASNSGAGKTLEYLQAHWYELNQLPAGMAPEKLLAIANHDGGSKALDIIQNNWASLSGFTNDKEERISVEQLENICNRKAASKALELLLENNHIKTLTMEDIVNILISDRRTHRFFKEHSNKK